MSDDALSQMAASFTNGVVRKNSTLGGQALWKTTENHDASSFFSDGFLQKMPSDYLT
jgi:hypothetical protein